MQVSGIKISFINSMVFITKSSSISAWLWLGLTLSFLMVQQKKSGIKGIKSLKKALREMTSTLKNKSNFFALKCMIRRYVCPHNKSQFCWSRKVNKFLPVEKWSSNSKDTKLLEMEENKQEQQTNRKLRRLSSVFLLEKGELKYFTRDSSWLFCKTRRQPKIVARFSGALWKEWICPEQCLKTLFLQCCQDLRK